MQVVHLKQTQPILRMISGLFKKASASFLKMLL
jgi:hypothetical protein